MLKMLDIMDTPSHINVKQKLRVQNRTLISRLPLFIFEKEID